MRYKVKTKPATEPLTLTEAKLHLRLTADVISGDTLEDTLVANLIAAAREYCEKYCGRGLATQTVEAYLDSFPNGAIELPMPPLQSVTSIKYKDHTGIEKTLVADLDYLVDTNSLYGRVVPVSSWPSFTPYAVNPITITYTAGYNDAPMALKQAMLLLIGHWYLNREAGITATVSKEIEFSVTALLSQYRLRWWD